MKFLTTLLAVICAMTATVSGAILAGDKNLGAIWCIGDSIMESVADGDPGSPRASLYNKLTAAGYNFTFTGHRTTEIGGLPVTGDTALTNLYQYHSGVSSQKITDFINGGVAVSSLWTQGRLAWERPNVIIIMLGTNDINNYNTYPTTGVAAAVDIFKTRMETLLNSIYALPGIGAKNPTVILSTVPPNKMDVNNGTPEQHMEAVIAFNAKLGDIVSDYQGTGKSIYLSDAFTLLNNEYNLSMNRNPNGSNFDNLHPGAYGNDLLAQAWFDTIESLVIPEPSTWALMVSGGAALLALARKRK